MKKILLIAILFAACKEKNNIKPTTEYGTEFTQLPDTIITKFEIKGDTLILYRTLHGYNMTSFGSYSNNTPLDRLVYVGRLKLVRIDKAKVRTVPDTTIKNIQKIAY